MLTCNSENLIKQTMSFQRMFKQCIEHAFDGANLKSKPEKAMVVNFRMNDSSCTQLLLWSPSNYVGVFSRNKSFIGEIFGHVRGEWDLHCYHDSCWRGQDGLEKVLDNIEDKVWGFWFSPWRIINIDEHQQKVLRNTIKSRLD